MPLQPRRRSSLFKVKCKNGVTVGRECHFECMCIQVHHFDTYRKRVDLCELKERNLSLIRRCKESRSREIPCSTSNVSEKRWSGVTAPCKYEGAFIILPSENTGEMSSKVEATRAYEG